MSCEIEAATCAEPVFRLGYAPDAWAWPPWQYVGRGRWDAPDQSYRVLYASTSRLAVFMETLASLQPEPHVEAQLSLIDTSVEETWSPGHIPADWLDRRRVGKGSIREGVFAHLGHSKSLSFFRRSFSELLTIFGVGNLDAADIRSSDSSGNGLTQKLSGIVNACHEDDGRRQFEGIFYESRLGDEFDNWAMFEPFEVLDTSSEKIETDDNDLREAARRLGLSPP